MLQTLKNIFSVKDIRKKLLFTVFIILLFRFGTFISVPGFDKLTFNEQAGAAGGLAATINLILVRTFGSSSIFEMAIGL